jgi:hypothetical protein
VRIVTGRDLKPALVAGAKAIVEKGKANPSADDRMQICRDEWVRVLESHCRKNGWGKYPVPLRNGDIVKVAQQMFEHFPSLKERELTEVDDGGEPTRAAPAVRASRVIDISED